MSYTIPPSLKAIIADANRVAPNRSRASDGTIGDLAHQAQGSSSDHNPDARGIVHAVDVTNDPANGMDTWHWGQIVASRMIAGFETRVEYLVSNDGQKDVIFHPSVHGNRWVQNGSSPKQEHRNHLHTSIKYLVSAENDISPYFVDSSIPPPVPTPPTPTEEEMFLGANFEYNGLEHLLWIDPSGDVWHRFNGHTVSFNDELKIGRHSIDPDKGLDVKVFGNNIKVLMISTVGFMIVGKHDGKNWTCDQWANAVQ